jgi:hypothetical protein
MALTKVSRGLLTTSIVDNGNATAITIDSSENVTFSGTLSLPNANATNEISFTGTEFTNVLSATTGGFQLGTTGAGYLSFLTNNAEGMRIDSGGAATFNSTVTINTDANSSLSIVDAGTNAVIIKAGASDELYIGANNTYALRVLGDGTNNVAMDNGGNLLVGRSSAGATGNGHSIRGGDSAIFSRASTGETMVVGRDTSNGDFIRFKRNNVTIGTITATGTSTAYNTSSDYRLKENVVELTGATERLKQLNPSRFNFIADADTTVDGFLAHEVQDVVPEAISGTKDAVDADGNPEYQGIDQSKLVPLLVATIQELEARLTALENN